MLVEDLIAECRVRLDDSTEPYLHAHADLIRWTNEAQIEACRRARLLSDSSISVSILAGKTAYNLPEKTIQIRRAKLCDEELPLSFCGSRDMDEDVAGWESHEGTPTVIITDLDSGMFVLYPQPISNDKLKLVIIKEPNEITDEDCQFQIQNRFHYGLVDWVLFRAFGVIDRDLHDKGKSLESLALFEQEFGQRSSAKDETFNAREMPYNNSDGYY